MSNDLATIANNLPAYAQATDTSAAALVTSQKRNRISLNDAKFILRKGDEEIKLKPMQAIPVVILGVNPPEPKRTAKVYYEGSYVEDGDVHIPDCFSNDGIRPDASCENPQSDVCASCKQNAWGSAVNDDGTPAKGKACSDRKILIVSLYNPKTDGPMDEIYDLSVPPTSLKALSGYGVELVKHNVNMHAIVTAVGIDEDVTKQMTFSYLKFLPEAAAKKAIARAASDEIKMLSAPSAAEPAPKPQSNIPTNVPDYAVEESEEIEEVVAAEATKVEEKRASKKKAAKKKAAPKTETVEEDSEAFDELQAMIEGLPGM